MHSKKLIVFFTIGLFLSGCGQKGPLYLPDSKPSNTQPSNTQPSNTQSKDSKSVATQANKSEAVLSLSAQNTQSRHLSETNL